MVQSKISLATDTVNVRKRDKKEAVAQIHSNFRPGQRLSVGFWKEGQNERMDRERAACCSVGEGGFPSGQVVVTFRCTNKTRKQPEGQSPLTRSPPPPELFYSCRALGCGRNGTPAVSSGADCAVLCVCVSLSLFPSLAD